MTSILDAPPIDGRRRYDFALATRLDICQIFKGGLATNWFIAKVAIFGGVDCEDEVRKIYKETPQAVITNKSTTALSKMFAKAAERGTECRHMEHVADENHLAVQRDDGCSFSKNRSKRFISHANIHCIRRARVVRYEG